MTRDDAYRRCVVITRHQARNFYFGIRLLPAARRRALCAIYAYARRIDDIGDGDLQVGDKRLALRRERQRLATIGAHGDDPVMEALADASARYPIPLEAFDDLIAGVEMDVAGTAYERFEDLVTYCRRVAGSIGRLTLGVFEAEDRPTASRLADDLGVALQITNILRDLVEDREAGRLYLPAQDLRRFGVGPALAGSDQAMADLVTFEAARAAAWFDRGMRLIPLLDRASASCVGTMAGIYRRLLDRIAQDPTRVLHERVSVPPWEKGWLAARSLVRAPA